MKFLAVRLAGALAVMFCVVTLTFFLIRLAPGGPFDAERKLPPAIEQALLAKYKLDGPVWRQYLDYLGDLLRGDLRLSTRYRNRTVNEILAQTLPVTMALGLAALSLATLGGITLGVLAAVRPGSWQDAMAMFLALILLCLPSFVLGPVLLLIFAIWLGWLPVGGWGCLAHLALPSLALAAPYMAYIARLTRGGMSEALSQDFIRTARAKGASEFSIALRHALRVGILPVVNFLGPLAAHLLTGSIVVEAIFHIPGAGGFFVNAILNRDGFLLGGVVIVYCALLVVFNLMADLASAALDPRIRLDG